MQTQVVSCWDVTETRLLENSREQRCKDVLGNHGSGKSQRPSGPTSPALGPHSCHLSGVGLIFPQASYWIGPASAALEASGSLWTPLGLSCPWPPLISRFYSGYGWVTLWGWPESGLVSLTFRSAEQVSQENKWSQQSYSGWVRLGQPHPAFNPLPYPAMKVLSCSFSEAQAEIQVQ